VASLHRAEGRRKEGGWNPGALLMGEGGGYNACGTKEDGAQRPAAAQARQKQWSDGHLPREAREELGTWATAVVGSAKWNNVVS
jgi:hypothetical protein